MKMHHTRAMRTAAVLGATLLIAAGCGDSGDDTASSTSSKDTSTTTSMDSMAMHDTKRGADSLVRSEAADTRITLSRLLGQHTTLATIATMRALEGGKDFDQTAAALTANGEALADVIGSVYGDDARTTFLDGWNDHIGYLVDYTKATAASDAGARAKAVKNLDAYVESFGEFLSTATELPPQAVKDGLKAHVQHHVGVIDAFAAGKYRQAFTLQRAGYEHMVGLGAVLGDAIATQQKLDAGDTTTAGVDTRSLLGSQLAEHSSLAYIATTNALSGSKAFEQSAAALSDNSKDLGDTIESVYGAKARAAFDKQWADHIGYLVDYTTAVAKGDDAGKQQAVDDLAAYVESFGTFLAGATDLPPQAVKNGLDVHVKHHAGSIDAFAAGNYQQALSLDDAASEHMWGLGDTLADAITKQSPDKFGA